MTPDAEKIFKLMDDLKEAMLEAENVTRDEAHGMNDMLNELIDYIP